MLACAASKLPDLHVLGANARPDRDPCTAWTLRRDPDGVSCCQRQQMHPHQKGAPCPHSTTQPFLTHHPCSIVVMVLHVDGIAHALNHLTALMLAHAAGKSWQGRCGVEPGRQEPTATLSAAILALQMISMLQASCWPTWPSSPSVNQAALTAHLCRGQHTLCCMHIPSFWPAFICTLTASATVHCVT